MNYTKERNAVFLAALRAAAALLVFVVALDTIILFHLDIPLTPTLKRVLLAYFKYSVVRRAVGFFVICVALISIGYYIAQEEHHEPMKIVRMDIFSLILVCLVLVYWLIVTFARGDEWFLTLGNTVLALMLLGSIGLPIFSRAKREGVNRSN